ncbi:hypothetical protein RO07_25170 [Pandoraea pulmonicola]|uniref:Uncharacterized protein n=1 Tax=Pandoraea pulmonicola TaxID=93221 RepID=A0ABM6FRY5_PANPU|nr:hypothetical protein RO07_25170 [Pandoraea pulmonicola]
MTRTQRQFDAEPAPLTAIGEERIRDTDSARRTAPGPSFARGMATYELILSTSESAHLAMHQVRHRWSVNFGCPQCEGAMGEVVECRAGTGARHARAAAKQRPRESRGASGDVLHRRAAALPNCVGGVRHFVA